MNRGSIIVGCRKGIPEMMENVLYYGMKERLASFKSDDLRVLELRQVAGVPGFTGRPLDYAWPDDVYSLTHVALPFPLDDQIYGLEMAEADSGYPRLGQVHLLGESGALILPPALLQRLRSNPFYGYITARLEGVVNPAPGEANAD